MAAGCTARRDAMNVFAGLCNTVPDQCASALGDADYQQYQRVAELELTKRTSDADVLAVAVFLCGPPVSLLSTPTSMPLARLDAFVKGLLLPPFAQSPLQHAYAINLAMGAGMAALERGEGPAALDALLTISAWRLHELLPQVLAHLDCEAHPRGDHLSFHIPPRNIVSWVCVVSMCFGANIAHPGCAGHAAELMRHEREFVDGICACDLAALRPSLQEPDEGVPQYVRATSIMDCSWVPGSSMHAPPPRMHAAAGSTISERGASAGGGGASAGAGAATCSSTLQRAAQVVVDALRADAGRPDAPCTRAWSRVILAAERGVPHSIFTDEALRALLRAGLLSAIRERLCPSGFTLLNGRGGICAFETTTLILLLHEYGARCADLCVEVVRQHRAALRVSMSREAHQSAPPQRGSAPQHAAAVRAGIVDAYNATLVGVLEQHALALDVDVAGLQRQAAAAAAVAARNAAAGRGEAGGCRVAGSAQAGPAATCARHTASSKCAPVAKATSYGNMREASAACLRALLSTVYELLALVSGLGRLARDLQHACMHVVSQRRACLWSGLLAMHACMPSAASRVQDAWTHP